jgi:hypothetical protein
MIRLTSVDSAEGVQLQTVAADRVLPGSVIGR